MADLASQLSDGAAAALDALLAEPDAIKDVDLERMVGGLLARLELRKRKERSVELQRQLAASTPDEKDRLVEEKQANAEEIRRLSTNSQPA